MSPIYEQLKHNLTLLCNRNGYALAVHGSLIKDLDLVAIPFQMRCLKKDTLFAKVDETISANKVGPLTQKAFGRTAKMYYLDDFHCVDFSIVGFDESSIENIFKGKKNGN